MDGLLLVNKPAGITSHDVVDHVRRIARTRRVGHAGTLDPFATGLLILGVNNGTKTLTNLIGLDKTYEATARLGATSTTDDPEGSITEQTITTPPTRMDIENALATFRGGYLQTAPLYSAKKIGGKKLYELARKGQTEHITPPTKQVTITELTLATYTWPDVSFTVSCSSGTYIRALARDIGKALGTGAYLTALNRSRIGEYRIRNAASLDQLDENTLNTMLIPL